MLIADQIYSSIMPFGGVLGDSRYEKSLSGISRVQELSLRENVRGPDVPTAERNLFCGPGAPDS